MPCRPSLRASSASLVKDAGELGELEQYQYLDRDGKLMTGRKFPPRWIGRLSTAIEKGVFAHLSIDAIVEIMLIGPR